MKTYGMQKLWQKMIFAGIAIALPVLFLIAYHDGLASNAENIKVFDKPKAKQTSVCIGIEETMTAIKECMRKHLRSVSTSIWTSLIRLYDECEHSVIDLRRLFVNDVIEVYTGVSFYDVLLVIHTVIAGREQVYSTTNRQKSSLWSFNNRYWGQRKCRRASKKVAATMRMHRCRANGLFCARL